jgi:pimeloyl-ACP methyl ester carboxylesterase
VTGAVLIEHETVAANGIRLHAARAGRGPLMLFLHGFPEYWAMWKPFLEHFGARGRRAVAPDLRGYNLSDKPSEVEAYKSRHLVADVLALAAHYTQEPFVLVGHDWGGAVAWAVAIAHADRLSHLIMVNSPHPYVFWRELTRNPAQQKASEYMLLFRSDKAERVLAENGYARLLAAFSDLDEPARAALVESWSRPGALTGGLNYYRASPLYPPAPEDPGAARLELEAKDFVVRVPTLVIWGERDTALLPGCLEGLDQVVPGVKVVRVPEATHWVTREKTARVIEEMEQWLAKH